MFFKEREDESLFLFRVLAPFPWKQRRKAERNKMRSQAAVGMGLTLRVPQGRGPSFVSLERDVSVNLEYSLACGDRKRLTGAWATERS